MLGKYKPSQVYYSKIGFNRVTGNRTCLPRSHRATLYLPLKGKACLNRKYDPIWIAKKGNID